MSINKKIGHHLRSFLNPENISACRDLAVQIAQQKNFLQKSIFSYMIFINGSTEGRIEASH